MEMYLHSSGPDPAPLQGKGKTLTGGKPGPISVLVLECHHCLSVEGSDFLPPGPFFLLSLLLAPSTFCHKKGMPSGRVINT